MIEWARYRGIRWFSCNRWLARNSLPSLLMIFIPASDRGCMPRCSSMFGGKRFPHMEVRCLFDMDNGCRLRNDHRLILHRGLRDYDGLLMHRGLRLRLRVNYMRGALVSGHSARHPGPVTFDRSVMNNHLGAEPRLVLPFCVQFWLVKCSPCHLFQSSHRPVHVARLRDLVFLRSSLLFRFVSEHPDDGREIKYYVMEWCTFLDSSH